MRNIFGKYVAATFAASLLLTLALVASGAPAPRVAVFAQEGFPFYGSPEQTSPLTIARNLKLAGLRVDLLDAAALADPERFNALLYHALVLPYGNTYPQAAFANLKVHFTRGAAP